YLSIRPVWVSAYRSEKRDPDCRIHFSLGPLRAPGAPIWSAWSSLCQGGSERHYTTDIHGISQKASARITVAPLSVGQKAIQGDGRLCGKLSSHLVARDAL